MRARCLEICASGQRTQNEPTNLRRSVCGGCRPPITLAQISTPFPAPSTPRCHPPPLPDLFRLRIPSAPLVPRCSRPLLHLSPTTTASACIGANLPRPRVFRDSFRPESIPPRDESRQWGRRRRASGGCNRRYWDSASSV